MALKFFILLTFCTSSAYSANILGIFPMTFTGDDLGYHLMNELSARGHNVTVLNLFPVEEYHGQYHTRNYTDIYVKNTFPLFFEFTGDIHRRQNRGMISSITGVYRKSYEITKAFLSDESVQLSLRTAKLRQDYDLVVLEYYMNDAALAIGKVFNAPVVLFSGLPATFHINPLFANPAPSSYIPNILTSYNGVMTFWQRANNLAHNIFSDIYRQFFMLPRHDKIVKELINSTYDLKNIFQAVELILLNSHPVVTEPVSLMPNMVEIGGLHIRETLLPDEIQLYLDSAVDGVIFVSTRFRLENFDVDYRIVDAVTKAFVKRKQKLLWHSPGKMSPPLPENVKVLRPFYTSESRLISSDAIQQSILAHPNVVAFFSQGDLNDFMEAVYFGVPVIAIPLKGEQFSLANQAAENGYALYVPYEDLTEETVDASLNEILNNSEYAFNARNRSIIMMEDIVKPMDLAMHWIEFVLRNGGTKYLQSPGVPLEWYKRSMLDIIIVLTLITVILSLIFYYIIKHIIHYVVKKVKNRKERGEKYSKLKENQN